MTPVSRSILLSVLFAAGLGCAWVQPADAQGAPAAKKSAKASKASKAKGGDADGQPAARNPVPAYAAGTRAFEAGNMGEAIQSLSAALSIGGLPPQQMAKALYYRGAAYRKSGKPAQAISDLTTSMWLKGGLTDADRALATQERQTAYREAGLGDSPPPVGQPTDAVKSAAGKPAQTAAAPQAQPQSGGFWNGIFGGGNPGVTVKTPNTPAAIPPVTPVAGAPGAPVPPGPGAPPAPGAAPGAPQSGFATTVAEAPQAAAQQAQPQQSGGFWQNLFGGGGNAAPAETPQVAAVPPPAEPAPPAQPTPPAQPVAVAEVQPWQTQTATLSDASPTAAAGPGSYGLANPEPAQPASNPLTTAGSAITNFFKNPFGGGSSAEPTPAPAAAIEAPPAAGGVTASSASAVQYGDPNPQLVSTSPAGPAQGAAEGLPWASPAASGDAYRGGASAAASGDAYRGGASTAGSGDAYRGGATTTAAAPPATPPRTRKAAAGGKYRLQVAAVRSREEAEQMAAGLRKYQAMHNSSVEPEVDEAVLGSMGTFYRVRLGPYATAQEPDQLCKTLKPQGFDCLVVTQ